LATCGLAPDLLAEVGGASHGGFFGDPGLAHGGILADDSGDGDFSRVAALELGESRGLKRRV
jgi:hypothetical protein